MTEQWQTFGEQKPEHGQYIRWRYDDHPNGYLSRPAKYIAGTVYDDPGSANLQWRLADIGEIGWAKDNEAIGNDLKMAKEDLQVRIKHLVACFENEHPGVVVTGITTVRDINGLNGVKVVIEL